MTLSLPRFIVTAIFASVFATGLLTTQAVADEKMDTARAPLIAFIDGVIAGDWEISAHANFAHTE